MIGSHKYLRNMFLLCYKNMYIVNGGNGKVELKLVCKLIVLGVYNYGRVCCEKVI